MKTTILKYPIFAKGKGLPKDGACVANAGERVEVEITAGQHYVHIFYKGQKLRIATRLT